MIQTHVIIFVTARFFFSYSQNEADGGHSGCGHDFGAVGHQVQQRGHDALGSMVKLVTQDGR